MEKFVYYPGFNELLYYFVLISGISKLNISFKEKLL